MYKGKERDLFSGKSINTNNLYTKSLKNDTGIKNGEKTLSIPLKLICQRYENLFIKDPDDLKILKNSILTIGLTDPIRIVPITLKLDKLNEEIAKEEINEITKLEFQKEIEYLKRKQDVGKEYTISAGHRRFDACLCVALETFFGSDYIDYSSDISIQFDKVAEELDERRKNFEKETAIRTLILTEKELEEKKNFNKLNIDAYVEEKNFSLNDDTKVYQDTNLTARTVTVFEVISNIYKQLTLTGEIEQFIDESGKLNFKNFKNYILENHNEDIDVETIRRHLKIYNTFRNDLKELIYSGKLTVKAAVKILPKYKKLSEKDIDNLVKSISENEFNLDEWLKQFDIPEKKKKYETKEDKLKKDFVLDARKVKFGKMSIDQLIEKYSN